MVPCPGSVISSRSSESSFQLLNDERRDRNVQQLPWWEPARYDAGRPDEGRLGGHPYEWVFPMTGGRCEEAGLVAAAVAGKSLSEIAAAAGGVSISTVQRRLRDPQVAVLVQQGGPSSVAS